MSPWAALKADTHRVAGGYSPMALLAGFFRLRTFRVIVTLRLCQGAAASALLRPALPMFKLLHRLTTHAAAMDLAWSTRTGAGIALMHGWGLVVNQQVTLGSNVTLMHGVTLGQRDRIAPDGARTIGYPCIEDEVWIGPNAIIVGGVTVGRGSRIGGGAFVTEDVPPYSVVAGNPSVIVKHGCAPDVVNPAPL